MFRFTIRDLLWLMVVVAMACGWWRSDVKSHEERANIQEMRQLLGEKGFDELIAVAKKTNRELSAIEPSP
jgi:hypothetical protein